MNIENLQIEIKASSDKATASLEKLESVLKRIDAIGRQKGLDALYQKLKKIASLNFSGVGKGMDGMTKSFDNLSASEKKAERFSKTIKKVEKDVRKTSEAFSELKTSSDIPMLSPLHPVPFSGISKQPASLFPPLSPVTTKSPFPVQNSRFSQNFDWDTGYKEPNWEYWTYNLFGSKEMFDSLYRMWSRNDFGNVPNGNRLNSGTIQLGQDQWREYSGLQTILSNLKSRFNDLSQSFKKFRQSLKSTDKDAKKTNKTFKEMRTILMYSLLFSAVSSVFNGISDGLENIAMHSKEANQVLTQYKTLTLELKNALGSALIPILQTLYPVIQLIANALIEVANALNILFSAINGSKSFLMAKKYTDDYVKSLGKLKGMAGMDQIHTIGQTYDYSKMFEETEITGEDILQSLLTILPIASVAIAGIAGKISNIVKSLGAMGISAKKVLGLFLTIDGVCGFVKENIDAWVNGIDWENFTGMILRLGESVGGLALAFGKTHAAAGLVAGGLVMVITGIKDLITNGRSLENTFTIVFGIMSVGFGAMMLGAGGAAVAVAGIIAAIAVLAIWGDKIVAWLDNFQGLFDGWIDGIKSNVFGFFDNIIEKVGEFSPGLASALGVVRDYVGALLDWFKANFDWLISMFRNFVQIIYDLFHGDFKAVWEDLKTFFSDFWKGFVNVAIVPLNFLITCFESLVNFFIRGINFIVDGINKISFTVPDWVPGIGGNTVGFNLGHVPEVQLGRIPGYETGGFPEDGLFMANHNELVGQFSNGKTAVANNEQIIAGISRGVSEGATEQNALLREQNKILTKLLQKSGSTVSVSTITKGLERQNRRNGKVIVPVGN